MEDVTVAPSAEPAYLSRLALSSIPFGVSTPAKAFYKSPTIEQRLNLVLHLVRASDKITLLRAPEGYGKSVFLDELQRRFGEDIRVCRIQGSRSLNLQTFSATVLSAFGVDSHAPDVIADPQHSLKQHLTKLRQLSVTPILLVDDIEQLAEPVMQVLTVWLGWQQQEKSLLQAVLTCQTAEKLSDRLHERVQLLDIPLLSEDEVSGYLLCRLRAAGFSGDLPFNRQQLKRLFRLSAGHPAKLNQLAHQQLLGHGNGMSFNLPKLPSLNLKLPFNIRWLWMAPAALLIVALLFNQQRINDWLQQGQGSETMAEPEVMPADDLKTVIIDDPELPQADELERETLLQLLSDLDQQVTDVPLEQEDATTALLFESVLESGEIEEQQAVVEVVTEPEADTVAESLTEAETETATVTTNDEAPQTTPARASDRVHQHDWILQQRGTSYTFQLMGSWELDEIDAFIEKYALSGDVAVFASLRNDRVWYALIYGVYSGRQQAMTANTNWPAPLNTVPTWLRRIDSVQQQIRERSPQSQ